MPILISNILLSIVEMTDPYRLHRLVWRDEVETLKTEAKADGVDLEVGQFPWSQAGNISYRMLFNNSID